jgi:two-component system NarL family response regulator
MTSAKIRVLVAEDSPVTRLGVSTLLRTEPDIEVVAEAENGADAVRLFRQMRPDVVLLDLRMPELDGVQATEQMRREDPAARVLVLTNYDGDEVIFQALKAGAAGYLTKGVRGPELITAIRQVHAGDRYLPPGVAGRLADRMMAPSLSPREVQVLEKIYEGLTNKEIAEALHISLKTASMFVSKILLKLDVRSRTEAVAVALRRGILRPR